MPPIAWIAIITAVALWVWFLVAMLRAEKRASAKRWAEYDALVAAFNALPKPKDC